MQTLQKTNLQVACANQRMTFASTSDLSAMSALNDRYVCACSAE